MIIHPEVIVTPDCPTIRFREAEGKINLDVELPRILQVQGWSVGTYFNVQFISHDRTKLLKSGQFVVTEDTEGLQTNAANPYQPVTKVTHSRKAKQIGDWWQNIEPQEIDDVYGFYDNDEGKEESSCNDGSKRRGRPPKEKVA